MKASTSVSFDYESVQEQAKNQLHPDYFGYYQRGSGEQLSVTHGAERLDSAYTIIPNYGVGIENKFETDCHLLNGRIKTSMPLGVAPTGAQTFAHSGGELENVRGCQQSNVVFVHSAWSHHTMKEIAEAAQQSHRWQNLYLWKNKQFLVDRMNEAASLGFEAIVLTLDIPVFMPRGGNSQKVHLKRFPLFDGYDVPDFYTSNPAYTWEDFKEFTQLSPLPIVAKGIMSAKNARQAVMAGAQSVWLSTHGGRQLDSMRATINVLPEVVDAVGKEVDVYLDSGVRNGQHVFKALALGAKHVFVGRAAVWALATGAQSGVHSMLEGCRQQLTSSMLISGW